MEEDSARDAVKVGEAEQLESPVAQVGRNALCFS